MTRPRQTRGRRGRSGPKEQTALHARAFPGDTAEAGATSQKVSSLFRFAAPFLPPIPAPTWPAGLRACDASPGPIYLQHSLLHLPTHPSPPIASITSITPSTPIPPSIPPSIPPHHTPTPAPDTEPTHPWGAGQGGPAHAHALPARARAYIHRHIARRSSSALHHLATRLKGSSTGLRRAS